jgi:hypothetical protein
MNKYFLPMAAFLCALIAFPLYSRAQTDSQLTELREQLRKAGVEPFIRDLASATKGRIGSLPQPAPNMIVDDVIAQGRSLITIWKITDQLASEIDPSTDFNALKKHSVKTVCAQKVRGMLVNEFGATINTRVVDKVGKLIYEVKIDKSACDNFRG